MSNAQQVRSRTVPVCRSYSRYGCCRLSFAVPGTSPIGVTRCIKDAAHWQRRRAICFIQHRNGRGDRREFLETVSQPELGGSRGDTACAICFHPAGMSPNMYQYRPPIDLANPQLRKLASALGPAYVRVGELGLFRGFRQSTDHPALRDCEFRKAPACTRRSTSNGGS
jgi:hypothetical protein